MEISGKEVLRYLGYRGVAPDGRISSLVGELSAVFTANVVPKSVYGIWGCQVDSSTTALGGMAVNSENLAEHLEGCDRAALLAATLGTEADTLLRRYSVQDMEKAVIAQAVCSAMLEAYCDDIETELAQKPELGGLCPRPRFSPGYGDFDIYHQKDILSILKCGRIGLSLSDGCMLIPSKSVTAVIGFSQERRQAVGKCGRCAARQCEFREAP